MSIVNVEDLFQRAAKFEELLEEYYVTIRDESTDNGVRLLTYYLSRHRRHLEQVLKNFSAADIAHVEKVQLKYDIDFSPEKAFQLIDTEPREVKGKQLLEAAASYDEALINLYKSVLKQPVGPLATTVFESLVRIEERDVVMIKKMIAMDYF